MVDNIPSIQESEGICTNYFSKTKVCDDGTCQTLGNGLCMVCWDRRISVKSGKQYKNASIPSITGHLLDTFKGSNKKNKP